MQLRSLGGLCIKAKGVLSPYSKVGRQALQIPRPYLLLGSPVSVSYCSRRTGFVTIDNGPPPLRSWRITSPASHSGRTVLPSLTLTSFSDIFEPYTRMFLLKGPHQLCTTVVF